MTASWRIAVALTCALLVGILVGTVNASTRWTRYTSRSGDVVIFRTRCLASEDSAAHPRLRSFEDGRIVYGCFRGGY